MAGGVQLLAKQIADSAEARSLMMFEMWEKAIESPIERLMFVGLCTAVDGQEALCFDRAVPADGRQAMSPQMLAKSKEPGALVIHYQLKLLDWSADFVLSVPTESSRKLIVECDGHDFHERTKEQAARDRSRDRAVVAAGHRILRYTGSELYRDPMKCVREVLKQAIWLCIEE